MLYLSKDFSDYLCDKRNFSALPIIYAHLRGSIFEVTSRVFSIPWDEIRFPTMCQESQKVRQKFQLIFPKNDLDSGS